MMSCWAGLAAAAYQHAALVARPDRAPVGRSGPVRRSGWVTRPAFGSPHQHDPACNVVTTMMVGSVAGFSIGFHARIFVVGLNRLDRSILCIIGLGGPGAGGVGGIGLAGLLQPASGRTDLREHRVLAARVILFR